MNSKIAYSIAFLLAINVTILWSQAPEKSGKSKVTYANFIRILPGMTSKEVEEILGPPGIYTDHTTYILTPPMPSSGYRLRRTVTETINEAKKSPIKGQEIWYGDQAFITIYFDSNSKVSKENGRFFDRAFVIPRDH